MIDRMKEGAKLMITVSVKVVSVHEAALLGGKTAEEVGLKGGFGGGFKEEEVSEGEMEGGKEEANGFHDVPAELPEGEPHEGQCLKHKKGKSAIKLSSHQSLSLLIYHTLLLFHCF